jgi:hypothetical protein
MIDYRHIESIIHMRVPQAQENLDDFKQLLRIGNNNGRSSEDITLTLFQLVVRHILGGTRRQYSSVGRINDIAIAPSEITLTLDDQSIYHFVLGERPHWRDNSGCRISRNDLEFHLNVLPGFIDAIELMATNVVSAWERLSQQLAMKHEELTIELENQYKMLCDLAQIRSKNGRHPELAMWRSRSTSSDNPPESLRSVRHIKKLDTSLPCHIYFLCYKGAVVYVGQTSSAWPSRIIQHLNGDSKLFDDVWYLEVDKGSLNTVERHYIELYRPKYNKQ